MFRYRSLFSRWSLICAIIMVCAAIPTHTASAAPLQANLSATLVQTIETSEWSPPSPDPSGITYWPSHDTLLVADAEVEEMPIFTGDNLFETTRGGSLVETYSTVSFSNEPTGIEIAVNPTNNHLFVSDDGKQKIFEVDLGADGQYGTNDDRITSFNTAPFGNRDPEGLAFGAGKLFVTDGVGAEIYVMSPGPNGRFDGISPAGDDQVTHFDTGVLGQPDPEGVDYNPATNSLYIISNDRHSGITETTISGSLLNQIDISFLGVVAPGDIAVAPGSQNTSVNNLYIVDRGVDNNNDPNENDGRIYELSVSSTPPPPPTGNRLLNPGFELDTNNDGKPDTWSTNNKFTRSSAQAHGGTYAGRFFATDNSGATIKQTMSGLAPNSVYTFIGWVNIPSTSDAFEFKLRVKWRNSANDPIRTDTIQTFTTSTSGSWTQVTRALTAPAGTVKADMMLVVSNLNATLYVDDFVFSE